MHEAWMLANATRFVAYVFGDMTLPDVLIALAACERRGDFSRPCGAGTVSV